MAHTPWPDSIAELDRCLRAAGIQPAAPDGIQSARAVDEATRLTLAMAARDAVRRARLDAPRVQDWWAASASIILNDDGSPAAQARADLFWARLDCIVNGCHALILLGDLSELPFFIELLRCQPGGHLTELAAEVLRHYVDPLHELDTPQLVRRADEWCGQAAAQTGPPADSEW